MMDFFERIKKPIPIDLSVSPKTTPVVYFGSYSKAKACTISLNPSDREFYDPKGELLVGNEARLCSRKMFEKNDDDVLSDDEATKVLNFCDNYFMIKPYKIWFAKYEEFLNVFGLSYYQESVVHLDLVQWATNPFWSGLDNKTKSVLLQNDLPFLEKLLTKKFEYIFLNGRTVLENVQKHLGVSLHVNDKVLMNGAVHTLYNGNYGDSVVIGWSPYLMGPAIGGYDKIRDFAREVRKANNIQCEEIKENNLRKSKHC